ncbi:MAG: M20/M25/M40 family metallo-hydrolase [Limisphaerales bacterium]
MIDTVEPGGTSWVMRFLTVAVLIAGIFRTFAADTFLPEKEKARAREIFRELIELRSTHDVGTAKIAEAIATRLKTAGFSGDDVQILAPKAGKENVVVRFRGSGSEKPILFIGHIDVVEAKREDWTFDPFKLTERDGYFYGRGATDMKNDVAALVEGLIRLKEEGFKPAGDCIVAFTADEEAGGNDNGVAWLIEAHRPLIDAQFCINPDGGGGDIKAGKYTDLGVQTAEKVYLSFRLEAKDKGGHSSVPTQANPIFHLAQGLARLSNFKFPIHINETVRKSFAIMAETEKDAATAADLKAVSADPGNWAAADRLAVSPVYNCLMRTTATATMISGGHAENALPQVASAIVNCRILPEDSADEVEATLKRIIADEKVSVTRVDPAKASPASPVDPYIFGTVEKIGRNMWPGIAAMPVMMAGATDGLHLRGAGIPVYGISGMFTDFDDPRAHGKDERIGINDYYNGVEFTYRLMKALGQETRK